MVLELHTITKIAGVFLPVGLTIPKMILRCILVWFIPITCAFQAHSPVQLVRLGVSLQGMEIMLMEREKCGQFSCLNLN